MSLKYAGPIPKLGLGTFGRTGDAGVAVLLQAIEIGYRHLDTAQSYDTEEPVGKAIRQSGLPRSEFFLTTKVADTKLDKASFLPSVEASIETLGVGPSDLLLIHWPSEKNRLHLEDYVLALAEAQQRGLTRLIGVSNFPIALLERTESLLGKGAISTNQVEIHPYLQAPKLRNYARSKNMPLTAYRPLTKGEVQDDPVLKFIASGHGVTTSAIALAFLMAEGHIVIPSSGNIVNLKTNLAASDVKLSIKEIEAIRALDRGYRSINPEKSPAWDD